MAKLYISDMHFFHDNLNHRMDCRGFKNAEELNAHMIRQWNSRVTDKDEVFLLGDFSAGYCIGTTHVLEKLNGKLHLILANHDELLEDKRFDRSRFVWIKEYAEIRDNKRKVILCHYPVFCYNGQYRRNAEEVFYTYMLYGHVHNSMDEMLVDRFIKETRQARRVIREGHAPEPVPCQMINCFCMFSDYIPLTLDEWIAVDADRRAKLPQYEVQS